MRVLTKRLDSGSDLEGLCRSGYELALMDTCFVIEFIDFMPILADSKFIRRSRVLPAICDFIRLELQRIDDASVGFSPWRRLNKLLMDDSLVIYLKTGFGGGYFMYILNILEAGYLEAFKRAYAGKRGRSNKRDQYLYVAAAYLNQVGVNASVATIDRALLRSLKLSGIRAHPRPWLERAARPEPGAGEYEV